MASSGGGDLEWRVNVGDGRSEIVRAELSNKKDLIWGGIITLFVKYINKCWISSSSFLEKAWGIAKSEPKKAVHGLKLGLALTIVSIFYYLRPLNQGVGGNAMWAIMTVVVTFESTVGATFYKCVNRVIGTTLAGCLGIGVHWVASQSGDTIFEPIILALSLFLLASATTFSRFIPSVKSTFDYGTVIFVLTFCLVSISSYRVDKLFDLARTRLATIAIGTSLCILVSMLFSPIWAGVQLHTLTSRNLDKLADALDGCILEYFKNEDNDLDELDHESKVQQAGYKCVLNSKASEESMANFARWEPAHGRFGFRHPWKEYLKVGVAMRKSAYCIEALHGCSLNSEIKAPESLKLHLVEPCKAVSRCCSKVLKELSNVVETMKKSSRKIDSEVSDMNIAVQQLQNAIKSLPVAAAVAVPVMELLPLATLVSLLIETASRIEQHVVNAVETLANLASFDSELQDQNIKSLDNHAAMLTMRVFPDQEASSS